MNTRTPKRNHIKFPSSIPVPLLTAAVLMLMIGLATTFYRCSPDNAHETIDTNPNLLALTATATMPENAETILKDQIRQNQQENHFKTGHTNIFFDKNKWTGRIKLNDVSYQAHFAVNHSRVSFKTRANKNTRLQFSIYNPPGSQLTYSIHIETKQGIKKIFSKTFNEKTFFDGAVNIAGTGGDASAIGGPINGPINIMLITDGKGYGAWINPRLTRPVAAETNETTRKPNVVVVIVLDTLRRDHTSVYGYRRRTTPHLDTLAEDAVVYKNAFSTTSWTLPAHVSLFSGKDLSQHGVVAPADLIPWEYPLLAEVYQKNGYVTAAFTGGGFIEDSYGFHRGFQYYSNAPGNVFSMNSADRVFNHFKNYIERFQGENLFVFLHTYQIHSPYKAPRQYVDRIAAMETKNGSGSYEIDGNLLGIPNYIKEKHQYYKPLPEPQRQLLVDLYDASILYTDEALVGKVVTYLKTNGWYDTAAIAVLGDHGEEFYDHGSWEHGHTVYNELIRIPLVIKYPSAKGPGNTGDETGLTSIADVAGLLLKASGLNSYTETDFAVKIGEPGRVLPVLFPNSPIIKEFPPKVSFVDDRFHFIYNIYNVIDKKKKGFFNPPPRTQDVYELYAREDVKEKKNILKKHLDRLREYQKMTKEYLKRLEQMEKIKKNRDKMNNRQIDKELEKKLKSLGYLGN